MRAAFTKATGGKATRWRLIKWLIGGVGVLFLAYLTIIIRVRSATCGECRRYMVTYSIGPLVVRRYETDTPCSRWFNDTINESHEHVWIPGPIVQDRDILNRPFFEITKERGRTFWQLSAIEQLEFLSSAPPDQLEARRELVRKLYSASVSGDEKAAIETLLEIEAIINAP